MKKSTISSILMGIIIVLCISICFLLFCIVRRPRYIETTEQRADIIMENTHELPAAVTTTIENDAPTLPDTDIPTETADDAAVHMQGKTSTRVNIRNAPSEDGKVLETVDEGTTFDIVEVLDIGWTHILYNGEDAYISSAYVIITGN